jgi:hypothetical protein
MPTTARELIRRSLLQLGVIANRTTLPADQASDALATLNDLVASWALERFMIYHTPRLELTLVPGQGVYTWGPGGDIDEPRPLRLEMAQLRVEETPPYEWPVAVVTQAQYEQAVTLKEFSSLYPQWLYLESSYPLARLHVYFVPQAAHTLALFPWVRFITFPTLDTQVALPEGYERALRLGLQVELAPEYGRELPLVTLRNLDEARRAIKTVNTVVPTLSNGWGCGVGEDDTAIYRGGI